MLNPILLLNMWRYYQYCIFGLSLYNQINYTSKVVTYTGKSLYKFNRFIKGKTNSDHSDQIIIELIKTERKRKAKMGIHTDEWELL